ncbi:aldehyde dehydrogenase family protein [Embleya sp. NBC_00888]|uniref:aldehyde dehydrogenase family protein n=1 Tax=Embleya sp. NBC_00888 TaxID=2975960 RepID=UPI0038667C22|nr:aldehyde dehydrogenase family protein [Embleya sp. NBC_00888]
MTHLDIIDPRTGEVHDRVPTASSTELDAVVRAAATAFETWRSVTPGERQDTLLALAAAIAEHASARTAPHGAGIA